MQKHQVGKDIIVDQDPQSEEEQKTRKTWELIGSLIDAHSLIAKKEMEVFEKIKRYNHFAEYLEEPRLSAELAELAELERLDTLDRMDRMNRMNERVEIASIGVGGNVITIYKDELTEEFEKQWIPYKVVSVKDQEKMISEIMASSFCECVRRQLSYQKSYLSVEPTHDQ